MKVVHIVEALEGGVYTYFKDLSAFFGDEKKSEAIETAIIYSSNRNGVSLQKVNTEFSNNVTLINLDMVREISFFQDYRAIIKLHRELKKLKPDIIHLHSSKAGVLGRIAAFFLFKKVKLFYTPHGYAFLRTDISKNTKKFYSGIEKSFQRLFGGTIIACGDTEFEIAKKIGPAELIRNGVDIDDIRQHYLPQENTKLTIGILGRITAARNPKMFNDIALSFPQFNFIWIGDGELNHLITAQNITITGWILDKKMVFEQMNAIDIYLQTSLWEGLPIAILEAMVLEKPVIATNIIGNKDIVVPNKTGFLFNTIDELENYFEILKDNKTRAELGKNGLKRCYQYFDKNKNFKQLLELYQRYIFAEANNLKK
ncbi:glycosyltransferase [Flavobacterium anhuiense]|uniref:glycosyltransferase n=1 Tax=Flavobacterium anhuiense TaxID=459526 RepID=UPI001182AE76|nr:glycosyltransferase [Flavobacterium anhuiense]MCR4032754.1 glycosyltransferase [Flavobacterium panacis]